METKSFSSIEAAFLSKFNEGFKTFDSLVEQVPYNEKTLLKVIENLISRNVIRFNQSTKEYNYDNPVNGEVVILEGNVMLPVSIIKTNTKLIVSRGMYYEFDLDFDVRRIIWNVKLPNNTNSTLIDLIKSSVIKTKKTRNIQLPEYNQLVNKLVPWSSEIKLHINVVGEEYTDVDMIFVEQIYIDNEETGSIEFRNFTVKSEIKTEELISELMKPAEEKNFSNITLNHIFNLSDFIYLNNCIPYSYDKMSINYCKITGIRKGLELTYYRLNNDSSLDKLDMELFENINDGYKRLSELFGGHADKLLAKNNILIEMSE